MANQPESPTYDAGVYQIEAADPVDGGVGAVTNKPLLALSDRTAYLKQHVDNIESGATIPPTLAPINSPVFTGTPTVPTPAVGDNSTKVANTQFVQETVNGQVAVPVGGNANVVLTQAQWGYGILTLTGALTGNISLIFPTQGGRWIVENSTTGAFAITCKTAAGAGVTVAQGRSRAVYCDGTNVLPATSDFNNIALSGTSTAPTQPAADNTTNIATDAFVTAATDGIVTVPVGGSSNVVLTAAQYGLAILNLTGVLTGNINLVFPTGVSGQWIVANNATGAFNITATIGGAGKTFVLPQALAILIYSDGTNIFPASATGQSAFFKRQTFSQVAGTLPVGTTSLNIVGGFTPGNVLVEKNGALIDETTDFNDSVSPTITLTTATIAGDKIDVYIFTTFQVANAVQRSGDTMGGSLSVLAATLPANPVQLGQLESTTSPLQVSTLAATLSNHAVNFGQFPIVLGGNGYIKLPNGFILQWGTGEVAEGGTSFFFPIAFPSVCLSVVATPVYPTNPSNSYISIVNLPTLSNFGCTTNTGTPSILYIAIGK